MGTVLLQRLEIDVLTSRGPCYRFKPSMNAAARTPMLACLRDRRTACRSPINVDRMYDLTQSCPARVTAGGEKCPPPQQTGGISASRSGRNVALRVCAWDQARPQQVVGWGLRVLCHTH